MRAAQGSHLHSSIGPAHRSRCYPSTAGALHLRRLLLSLDHCDVSRRIFYGHDSPSGHVAGVYAQTDSIRGVWAAPANVQFVGVAALSQDLTAAESDALNSRGVDVIRSFPAQGIKVWSSRTTTNQDSDDKYVSVRRFMIFLEQSIAKGLQWAVFEPNGPRLWAVIRSSIENFLRSVWKQGALQGSTRQEAFFVRCDLTTMTQNDLDNGRLVGIVGVAPLAPAEFVIMQIGIWTECTPKLIIPLGILLQRRQCGRTRAKPREKRVAFGEGR